MKKDKPQLRIRLFKEWRPVKNTGALAAYVRGDKPEAATLQFSLAEYRHSSLGNVTEETLLGICEKITQRIEGRRNISRRSGTCDFGIYGTVAVKSRSPAHFQAWVISNPKVFILVTHISASEPPPEELAEASEIALMTRFE